MESFRRQTTRWQAHKSEDAVARVLAGEVPVTQAKHDSVAILAEIGFDIAEDSPVYQPASQPAENEPFKVR